MRDITEKPHHVKKYMRLAKKFGEDNNPCYSRKIGVVIVKPDNHRIVGMGYNSPPRNTPHCDEAEYLRDVVWPQLTQPEKDRFVNSTLVGSVLKLIDMEDDELRDYAVHIHAGCKICPRKLIGAESSKRLEICTCVHGEANAITNSTSDLIGCVMFCWCPLPCVECTKLIIQAGIKKVFCWSAERDYSFSSRWLFHKADVEIHEYSQEYYLEGQTQ